MTIMILLVLLVPLVVALSAPRAPRTPRVALNSAAGAGDVRAVRRIILESPLATIDLNAALACASKRSHVRVMAFLVDTGATDLDRALVQAAMRNQMMACRWLISEERHTPAKELQAAQMAAAATDSSDAEWLLLSKRLEAKYGRERDGDLDDLF